MPGPRWLTIGVNLVLAAALSAVLVAGILGSSPRAGAVTGQVAASSTVVHHPNTTVAPPPTSPPPTHPASTVPATTPPAAATTAPIIRTSPTYSYTTYPTITYPRTTYPTVTTIPTTTTSTTIAPLGGRIPVVASTLPLTTKSTSAHVSPVFAALSGGGFFLALCIVTVQLIRTRPRQPKEG